MSGLKSIEKYSNLSTLSISTECQTKFRLNGISKIKKKLFLKFKKEKQ